MKNNRAAELVRRIRKKLGVTQTELAALLDMDRSYLSLIENGKREPSLKLLRTFQRYWESVEKSSISVEKTGKQAYLESLKNAESVSEETQAVYGDPLKQMKFYMEQLFFEAQENDSVIQAWMLQQMKIHLPLNLVKSMGSKGEEQPPSEAVKKRNQPKFKTEPIEGTNLQLTENPNFREVVPFQKGGIRPEGPAVRPPSRSDHADEVSAE